MFYYLYEIRNNLNGKIYVGVHKTKDMNDGYMGSGKILKDAITQHGIENFTKTILEQFDNAAAMFAREKEIVTDEFLLREDVYNLRRGGTGGYDYLNTTKKNLYGSNGKIGYGGENLRKGWVLIPTEAEKLSSSIKMKDHWKTGRVTGFTGRTHTPDQVIKMRAPRPSSIGEKNSQFGTMWITNERENQKIKKDAPTPEGWRKGRVIIPSEPRGVAPDC